MTKAFLASWLLRSAWLFAACAAVPDAKAQTISVPGNPDLNNTTRVLGQSFTATLTGTVTAISVQAGLPGNNVTLLLYNGDTGSGLIGIGTPAYEQSNVTLQALPMDQWQTITLTTPFPVVAGSSYSFLLDAGAGNVIGLYGDRLKGSYPNGTQIQGYGLRINNSDLAFQIFEAAAPTPVPTLSEWTLIVLAGGLGLAGWAAVRRRSRQ